MNHEALHTGLRSLLETGYGVPRNAGRIVIVIEDGKPLEVFDELRPMDRPLPNYGAMVDQFAASRLEQATPSPFKRISPETCRKEQAEALAGSLPTEYQFREQLPPGATIDAVKLFPRANSVVISHSAPEESPPWD